MFMSCEDCYHWVYDEELGGFLCDITYCPYAAMDELGIDY